MNKWFQDLISVQEILAQLNDYQADLDGVTNIDIDVVKSTPELAQALCELEQSLGTLAIRLKATRVVFGIDLS